MCGIVGIVGTSPVNQQLYDALTVLQHRGQDAAGIMTEEGGELFMRKDVGLVRDVFQQRHMVQLKGNVGIGHVRYPTAGCDSSDEAQPFYVNAPYGICLAHNGNLTNATELAEALIRDDHRHLNTSSDSEVLLNVFASELQRVGSAHLSPDDIFDALTTVYRRVRGGYAVITLILGHGVVGFRDPNGIRPLVIGTRDTPRGREYMLASESVALDQGGFRRLRDVGPGEAVYIDQQGRLHTRQCVPAPRHTPCIFEYVYFARPDTFLDGTSVYEARMELGRRLGRAFLDTKLVADVVIPVPESARTAGQTMAEVIGVPCREGFVKNRYVGRTFIMPNDKARQATIRTKLNPIRAEFEGKRVVILDDSIVRGNTSRQMVKIARQMGAAKVYLASYSPPLLFPCLYGIDMSTKREFVARGRSHEEIARELGADHVVYQTIEQMEDAVRTAGNKDLQFCKACFAGTYPTGDITEGMIADIERDRLEASKV